MKNPVLLTCWFMIPLFSLGCDTAQSQVSMNEEIDWAAPHSIHDAPDLCRRRGLPCADTEELMEVFSSLIDRRIAGYPGGATEIEADFEAALAQYGVEDETLYDISDALDSSGRADRRGPMPVTRLWLHERLGEDTRAALSYAKDAADEEELQMRASFNYQVSVRAIKTHRCADDWGHEWGCDSEEPFIAHGAWGPGWKWFSETEVGKVKNPGDEYWFVNKTSIPSSASFSYDPIMYVWRVGENDPEEGNFNWVSAALAASSAVAKAFGGDWFGVFDAGLKLVAELGKIGGNGDDMYSSFFMIYDPPTLQQITSSTKTQPAPKMFFSLPAESHYKSMAIYNTFVPGGAGWNVLHTVNRL
ncbi:hypothetical protein [Nannocystis punicea]|uniref:Uncharacterized protein n=1 Tax=Nannocystis punicea TaxID=2995304 RepID=A0ABY7HJS5_9BACT|nr:hypothetical protein [Nannocystis poenicansa]WAS99302.1 hypothetical protein O0S08_24505 [Nannocystis poenicansa]